MEMPVSTPINAAPTDNGVIRPVTENPAVRLKAEAYPAATGGCLGALTADAPLGCTSETRAAGGLKFVFVVIGADSSVGARVCPGLYGWPEEAESCAMVKAGPIKREKAIFSPFRIKPARVRSGKTTLGPAQCVNLLQVRC